MSLPKLYEQCKVPDDQTRCFSDRVLDAMVGYEAKLAEAEQREQVALAAAAEQPCPYCQASAIREGELQAKLAEKDAEIADLKAVISETLRWHHCDKWRDDGNPNHRAAWERLQEKLSTALKE